tara:strand:- start:320 stop:1663 length:1344 start_codon:yes stop_codon:yes gene_type:complete
MRKFLYIFLSSIIIVSVFFSYIIISDKYDKQNLFILKIKEIVPLKLKNKLKSTIYETRAILNEREIQRLQARKIEQGLSGDLIESKEIKTKSNSVKYNLKEFFLPFKRLDLTYGWRAIENSKRAHYLETKDDKTIVVSGEGDFIYFDTKNFNSNKLIQKKLPSNLYEFLEKENFSLIGLRDLLIDNDKLYIAAILRDKDQKYTICILSSKFNYKKLKFDFLFKPNMGMEKYSIGTGGRIVEFNENKLLFTIGHFSVPEQVQNKGDLIGKIISIDKNDKSYELISLGHRNQQGLFYYEDDKGNQFIINSEHGPKGGDEINVNYLENNKLPNFGWPVASYGINYDGTNPFKSSHEDYGFVEPLKYFTPSIGISEISVKSESDSNIIYTSSLRAKSIYIIKTNKNFTKVVNEDRLILDYRIRDIKYVENLGGYIVILENTPSIGFIKISD